MGKMMETVSNLVKDVIPPEWTDVSVAVLSEPRPLPNVLSELCEIAAQDVRALAALPDKKFTFNMGHWIRGGRYPDKGLRDRGHCSACLAGSVLYRSNGEGAEDRFGPDGTGNRDDAGEYRDQMIALDAVRRGNWSEAIYALVGKHDMRHEAEIEIIRAMRKMPGPTIMDGPTSKKDAVAFCDKLEQVAIPILKKYEL